MARNSAITQELVVKLKSHWQFAGDTLSDEQTREETGVSHDQLRGRYSRDQRLRRSDGILGSEGLRAIRAHARRSAR